MDSRAQPIDKAIEIVFWQGINAQLIQLRNEGSPITQRLQQMVQKYCVGGKLYAKIQASPFSSDIPFSLMVSENHEPFISVAEDEWIKEVAAVFCAIEHAVFLVDLDRVHFDAYEQFRKRGLLDLMRSSDALEIDDDFELSEFIARYELECSSIGYDRRGISLKLHRVKAGFLKWLRHEPHGVSGIVADEKFIYFDLAKHPDPQRISIQYIEGCCIPAVKTLGANQSQFFTEASLITLLSKKSEDSTASKATREFAKGELENFLADSNALEKVRSELSLRLNNPKEIGHLPLFSLEPFHALSNPFPSF